MHFPLSAGLLLTFPSPLLAAPPALTNMIPRGGERGKPVEVVVAGANLTPQTRLVLPFKAAQKLLPDSKPNPAQVRFQLTVDPSVPLGIYLVRVTTEEGVSPFFLFSVDAFPNVNEVEDNNVFEKAQKVTAPIIITGQCAGGDVDYFQFPARKGQRLVVETESARLGSGIIPQIRVTDAGNRFLAADDTQALKGDCRLVLAVPADGDYIVEISDSRYRGANPPHYRLKIAEYDVVEEVFPLGGRRGEVVEFTLSGSTLPGEVRIRRTLDDALVPGTMLLGLDGLVKIGMLSPQLVVGNLPERLWIKDAGKDPKALDVLPPVTINSRLERKGDTDRFQFPVQPGQRFRITVQAEAFGSQLDGVLRVIDQAGKQLALVDDLDVPPAAPGLPATRTADPAADVTAPADANLLVVELRDQRYRGGVNFVYRLTVEPVVPDFTLQQPVAEANVPRGASAALIVPVIRRGYTGPVQLSIPDLPPGLSVQGGRVPANGTAGLLTLSAAPQASLPVNPLYLRIEGQAIQSPLSPEGSAVGDGVGGGGIHRWGQQEIVLSRDGNVASSMLTLTHFALGLTAPEPFTVQGPATIEVVKGYPTTVPVRVNRAMNQPGLAVEVSALLPVRAPAPGQAAPPGPLTVKPGTAAAGAANASLTVTATANAPEETLDVVVQGKTKINNADKTVTGPAVAVTVVKPFAVELLTPTLTLVPGQTVSLKGRLQRRPVFKEPVQLKLDGLPKAVTLAASPAPVPGTATDFQIDLKIDPKVVPAMANLTLTCSTTIAGMAYAHPPVQVTVQVKAGK